MYVTKQRKGENMKWFKHDSVANIDPKLRKLRIKYGMEGYGLYWYLLECIARNVQPHNLSYSLEEDSEIISYDTGIHKDIVEEMVKYMVNLGLFKNRDGAILCLKMMERSDEYTAKLLRISNQTPDKVPTVS